MPVRLSCVTKTTYGFDPDQPGVRRLVQLASEFHGTATVRLRALYIDVDGPHSPGELVCVSPTVATQLVVAGSAETVQD